MGEGEPIKNGIDSMSSDEFRKFRDQFRKKVKPNMEIKQSEESEKKKKEPDENSAEE